MQKFDYIIAGAGMAGCVMAERLAADGKTSVLLVEKRDHIGGNCKDDYSKNGVLFHRYGPHYFRTNSDRIIEYLSRFTEWKKCAYNVLAYAAGSHWSFPINLQTFEQVIGKPSTEEAMRRYFEVAGNFEGTVQNSEEAIISRIGVNMFKLFYEGYTLKQWGMPARELSPEVCSRIPIRFSRDARYFDDKFQALPWPSYSEMFRRMTERENIRILLKTDFREAYMNFGCRHLVYTGPIDAFFNWKFGDLPYRGLDIDFDEFHGSDEGCVLPALQVNYCDLENPYTRRVELKHITGHGGKFTVISNEKPRAHVRGEEAFYPIPTAASDLLYKKYEAEAENLTNVTFVGRLAEFKYLNMDAVVGRALMKAEKLIARHC